MTAVGRVSMYLLLGAPIDGTGDIQHRTRCYIEVKDRGGGTIKGGAGVCEVAGFELGWGEIREFCESIDFLALNAVQLVDLTEVVGEGLEASPVLRRFVGLVELDSILLECTEQI